MKKNRQIAILIETSSAYGRGLLRGVSRFLRDESHWSVDFSPHGLHEVPEWLATWRGDGILARIESRRIAETVARLGVPCIDLRGTLGDLQFPPFGADNRSVANAAFQHFRERGLTNFGFYGAPRDRNRYDDLRSDSFQQAVREGGYGCEVFAHPPARRGRMPWHDYATLIAAWIAELPKPIGILACHDEHGRDLLSACRRAQVAVPDDVAVMGVDNDTCICDLCVPQLTSVDLNTEQIGYEAAVVLDHVLEGSITAPEQRYFQVRGVVNRRSTDTLALDDPHVASAVRMIRTQACNGINVKDILDRVPLSQSTMQRRFKATMGHTIKAEIMRVRIALAKHLLVETELPVKKIARKVGFQQSKYFVQTFHRRVGLTPVAYRTKHAGRR